MDAYRFQISQDRVDEDALELKPFYAIAYTRCALKNLLFWFIVLSTAGFFLLIAHWFPALYLVIRYKQTNNLDKSIYLLVYFESGCYTVVSVKPVMITQSELASATGKPVKLQISDADNSSNMVKTFIFEHLCEKYIFDPTSQTFRFVCFVVDVPISKIMGKYGSGITSNDIISQRKQLYGAGCIEIPLPPLYELVAVEITHPFYIFQLLSFILWFYDQYYAYASAILSVTIIAIAFEIYTARDSIIRLRNISKYDTKQKILQNGTFVEQEAKDLLPGDVIQVSYGVLSCDMILLEGNVLINESMISGECIPVIKTPLKQLPQTEQNCQVEHSQVFQNLPYILYAGTEVIQIKSVSSYPVGLVIRTGFSSVQGHMMRTILHPRGNTFKKQTYKYLYVLIGIAFVAAFTAMTLSLTQNLHPNVVLIRFFDTFTNAIPAVLPATMTIGAFCAALSLRKKFQVMCIAPSRINTAGQVNTFVLDKTGTLTDDTYRIKGIITTNSIVMGDTKKLLHDSGKKECLSQNCKNLVENLNPETSLNENISQFTSLITSHNECPEICLEAMACCQNVSLLQDEIVGDLMEKQLLAFTQWSLEEKTTFLDKQKLPTVAQLTSKDSRVYIIHRFDFSPDVKRMSVLTYNCKKDVYNVFCKGAPEEIEQRCLFKSLPSSYRAMLNLYTKAGVRVIAYGYKSIEIGCNVLQMSRDSIENDLVFLHFVFFMNAIKPEVKDVITSLRGIGCTCIMATGDNPLTSIAVAHDSSMIDVTPEDLILISEVETLQHNGTKTEQSDYQSDKKKNTIVDKSRNALKTSIDSKNDKDKTLVTPKKWHELTTDGSTGSELIIRWKTLQYTAEYLNQKKSNNSGLLALLDEEIEKKDSTQNSDSLNHTLIPIKKKKKIDAEKKIVNYYTRDNDLPEPYVNFNNNRRLNADPELPLENDLTNCSSLTNTVSNTPAPPLSNFCEHTKNVSVKLSQQTQRLLTCEEVVSLLNAQNILKPKVILVLTGPALILLGQYKDTLHEDCKIELRHIKEHNYKKKLALTSNLTNNQKNSVVNSYSSDETAASASMPLLEYCLRKCRVYARMTPDDKMYLITQLQKLKGSPMIGMCGDGANDCKALKSADIGVSLSGAVTSLCAPLTSQKRTIQSCYHVLCEGRAALVNSFQNFKFVTLYAQTELLTTMLLFYYGSNLTDIQYLWIDLIIDLPLTMSMPWTQASEKLTPQLPLRRLIGPAVIMSLLGQFLIQAAFLFLGLAIVTRASFYTRFRPNPNLPRFESEDLEGYENSVLFMLTTWQFLILNLVLAAGRPWRKSRWTNPFYVLTTSCVAVLGGLVYIAFEISPDFAEWLGLEQIPGLFRLLMLLLVCLNFLCSYIFEQYVVGYLAKYDMARDQEKNCIDHVSHFTIT